MPNSKRNIAKYNSRTKEFKNLMKKSILFNIRMSITW